MSKTKHSSHGGKVPAGQRYERSYAMRKMHCGRTVDFSFTTGDKFNLEQWFDILGWKYYFMINAPYYIESVKEFYSNLSNVGDYCNDVLELTTKVNRIFIKFDDKILGQIFNVPADGSKFFETKKWQEDLELVLEDCLRVFYPNENVFGGMAKPTNLLGAEHRLLQHITATHILPTSGGHEKMSYQDLYIMWHVVTGKPLNLPHLIMKNMLRATSKVEGAFPYGLVITKILSHFGIVFGNEVALRLDVGDIYNASSLKRMGWKRVFDSEKGVQWLPKEGERKIKRVEGEGDEDVEEQGEAQRKKQTPAPQMQQGQASSSSKASTTMDLVVDYLRKLNIQMDNLRGEFLDLFYDTHRKLRRLEKKMIAKGLIEAADLSSSEEGESEEEGGDNVKT
ncbi:hypothetical protein CFOL_v3_04310 [Cephalotus follicularis]|uniref:Putative plant transposon protein domain-containing protein n=1 Tax=Cephalotus follicularis TaxID=3775 RepID=A0A1Q3AYE9_CEPFO|nr:hypothetical protein CFOL_v3_04310 [Cephalotus follicularis]